ncbi:MAG: hypothetical protein ACRER2_12620 [Methylococcales bacterium]
MKQWDETICDNPVTFPPEDLVNLEVCGSKIACATWLSGHVWIENPSPPIEPAALRDPLLKEGFNGRSSSAP